MGIIQFIIDFLQNPLEILNNWIASIGPVWILAPVWLVLFIETGVVIMPFLPGDSLLFALGTIAGSGDSIPLIPLLLTVWSAPIIGDESNYWIGRFFGKRILESGKVKAMTPERIAKTQALIDKWGPLAVFLGRFFPFIRTFMPFISGFNHMQWRRFFPFSVLGGVTWSTLFTMLGYFFGNVPFVQKHFELVIVAILVISLIPTIAGLIKAAASKHKAKKEGTAEDTQSAGEAAEPANKGDEPSLQSAACVQADESAGESADATPLFAGEETDAPGTPGFADQQESDVDDADAPAAEPYHPKHAAE
jgi:membrane-associated protein